MTKINLELVRRVDNDLEQQLRATIEKYLGEAVLRIEDDFGLGESGPNAKGGIERVGFKIQIQELFMVEVVGGPVMLTGLETEEVILLSREE